MRRFYKDFPKGYNIYNVGYGKSYSLNQVAEGLARLFGMKIEIEFFKMIRPDASDMVADIRKVSKEFNWKPTIDIKKGLQLIVREPSN